MKNITITQNGNILNIAIDMTKTQGQSKSGKNTIIATTGGNVPIPNSDAKLGLNLYK